MESGLLVLEAFADNGLEKAVATANEETKKHMD